MMRPPKMIPDAEVCIKAVRACLLAAARRGVDVGPILASRGLDPIRLADPDARVQHSVVASVWLGVPALLGDEVFGLHAAEAVHAMGFDTVDYAVMHAATLGEALARLTRYARLLHEGCSIKLDVSDGIARYRQRFDCEPPAPRQFVEFIFAMWALRVRRGVGASIALREIAFEHPAPLDCSEHVRLFAAPVRFGAAENEIVFDAGLLERPMVTADPVLVAVLERHARGLLEKLPPKGDPLDDIRRTIFEALDDGPPPLDRVARRLRTSRRSLQRRIRQEGATFQALVDEARREVVLGRLRDPDTTLSEIAFLAGFSDTTTFHRAFRRWTGSTPKEYRRLSAQSSSPR